jgi:hypothetical protein
MNIATGVDFVGRKFPHVLRPSLVLTGRHKAKNWITDLDARIKEDAEDVSHEESQRLAAKRLHDLPLAVGPGLANADWHRRREIIQDYKTSFPAARMGGVAKLNRVPHPSRLWSIRALR